MLDLLPVLRVLGILLMVFALTMGLPLGVSWVQGDGVWRVYPVSMAVTMGVGLALWVGLRRHQRELLPRRNAHAAVLRGKDFLHPVLRRNLLLLWRIALVFCQQVIAVMQGL